MCTRDSALAQTGGLRRRGLPSRWSRTVMATVVLFHSGDSQRAEEEMISEVLAPWLGLCRLKAIHRILGNTQRQ